MTADEVRLLIFHMIVGWDLDGHPAVERVDTAKELATSVFYELEDKGVLKLDDDEVAGDSGKRHSINRSSRPASISLEAAGRGCPTRS